MCMTAVAVHAPLFQSHLKFNKYALQLLHTKSRCKIVSVDTTVHIMYVLFQYSALILPVRTKAGEISSALHILCIVCGVAPQVDVLYSANRCCLGFAHATLLTMQQLFYVLLSCIPPVHTHMYAALSRQLAVHQSQLAHKTCNIR